MRRNEALSGHIQTILKAWWYTWHTVKGTGSVRIRLEPCHRGVSRPTVETRRRYRAVPKSDIFSNGEGEVPAIYIYGGTSGYLGLGAILGIVPGRY
ncbi:hypothetical protein ACRALDRAFT_1069319 [Sodiomyces alcalophilus JCM 7366]|uniref:uncharacterized protein n=1 Tax=Sodiomyces alcalophilus JCM 7366 TaxID=591952 RepID=UPI0039B53FC2